MKTTKSIWRSVEFYYKPKLSPVRGTKRKCTRCKESLERFEVKPKDYDKAKRKKRPYNKFCYRCSSCTYNKCSKKYLIYVNDAIRFINGYEVKVNKSRYDHLKDYKKKQAKRLEDYTKTQEEENKANKRRYILKQQRLNKQV